MPKCLSFACVQSSCFRWYGRVFFALFYDSLATLPLNVRMTMKAFTKVCPSRLPESRSPCVFVCGLWACVYPSIFCSTVARHLVNCAYWINSDIHTLIVIDVLKLDWVWTFWSTARSASIHRHQSTASSVPAPPSNKGNFLVGWELEFSWMGWILYLLSRADRGVHCVARLIQEVQVSSMLPGVGRKLWRICDCISFHSAVIARFCLFLTLSYPCRAHYLIALLCGVLCV